jgi:5,10-methylenetetrahydromethanopterin reductase
MSDARKRLGLVLGSAMPPEQLVPAAVAADRGGLDELWFSEDCFFTGGISAAAAALAATGRIEVGLGVVSAMLRHPALLAMEVTTMARAFPGRVSAGIGLGVPAWLRQVGRSPRSQLGAITECVTAVRRLLDGERLDVAGAEFSFTGVELVHPPKQPVPLYMGVAGPKMLQRSGALADGSVLSVCAGVRYLSWAREQIAAGQAAAGRTGPHRVVAFALYAVDDDRDKARNEIRGPLSFYLAADSPNAITNAEGVSGEVAALLEKGGRDLLASEMPGEWLSRLAVAGTPADCARQIEALYAAGADSVALFPAAHGRAAELAAITTQRVLPLLDGRG